MSQQPSSEFVRGQARKSEHFRFIQLPRGSEQDSRIANNKRKRHMGGFARWSEYVSEDSGDIEIPPSEYGSISLSKEDESSSMTDQGNSKQALQTSARLYSKVEELSAKKNKEEVKEKESDIAKQATSYAKSYNTILKEMPNSNSSPFTIPNISEIKPKETTNLTRNSERFLLELLNQDHDKEEEKIQFGKKGAKEQESDPFPLRHREQPQPRKSNTYKQIQKRQSERIIANKKQDSDPLPKHDVEPASKRKRVTINDRGKIKYPNDSISGDFSYILPEEFRVVEQKDSSSRKRKLVIEEQAEEEDKTGNEAMDVVDHREEEEAKAKAKTKEKANELKKAEERLTAIAKKAPVPKFSKKGKAEKKTTKIARVSDRQSTGKDSVPKKPSSNKSITTQPIKKVIEKQADTQRQPKKGSVANEELKRRKFKKQEVSQVEIIQSQAPEVPVENGRPKRNRTARQEFWKNKIPVYSKKALLLGLTNLSSEKFLEIIGFHAIDTIKTGKAYFSSKDIKTTINISPQQKIYSAGIDNKVLQECGLSHLEFDEIFITVVKKSVATKFLKAFVDDINEVDIEEGFKVRHGETFSIENTSAKKAQIISIEFHKGEEDSE